MFPLKNNEGALAKLQSALHTKHNYGSLWTNTPITLAYRDETKTKKEGENNVIGRNTYPLIL